MDSNRFDKLSRSLAGRSTRRRAVQGIGGGGLLAAVMAATGRSRTNTAAQSDDGLVCALDLELAIRSGPSVGESVGVTLPAQARGELRFRLGDNGGLRDGTLVLEDGRELPATGQATGSALTVRLAFPDGGAIVLVGAGERSIRSCRGAVDGLLTGPLPGDLGDWHATATAVSEADRAEQSTAEPTAPPAPPASDDAPAPPPEAPPSDPPPQSPPSDPTPQPPSGCLGPIEACTDHAECCSGICMQAGQCDCSRAGMPCDRDDYCCSGKCMFGVCACAGLGDICQSGVVDCCEGLRCAASRCVRENGASCTSDFECANYCTEGVCSDSRVPPCRELGQRCQSNDQCCSHWCDARVGEGYCSCRQEGDLCLPVPFGGCCSFSCRPDGTCAP